jgi:hypothetical protein
MRTTFGGAAEAGSWMQFGVRSLDVLEAAPRWALKAGANTREASEQNMSTHIAPLLARSRVAACDTRVGFPRSPSYHCNSYKC